MADPPQTEAMAGFGMKTEEGLSHPTIEPFPGLFESVANATTAELAQKAAEHKKISENKQNVWLEFLGKLRLYKETHGDCVVPRGYDVNPRLANWVCEQRKQYKLMKDNKKSNITQDRIDMLDQLGFAWNAQEAAWDRHFRDMKKFKEMNGHCLVPETHKEYPKLYVWIKEQRRHYSLWKQRKPSHMTEKRFQMLQEIRFCWDHREAIWSTRLEQLRHYKEKHGDCLVPAEFPENPKLGRWVKQQRKEYKKFLSQKNSQITQPRIAALDAIDFCWRANKNRVPKKGDKSDSDSENGADVKKVSNSNAVLNEDSFNPNQSHGQQMFLQPQEGEMGASFQNNHPQHSLEGLHPVQDQKALPMQQQMNLMEDQKLPALQQQAHNHNLSPSTTPATGIDPIQEDHRVVAGQNGFSNGQEQQQPQTKLDQQFPPMHQNAQTTIQQDQKFPPIQNPEIAQTEQKSSLAENEDSKNQQLVETQPLQNQMNGQEMGTQMGRMLLPARDQAPLGGTELNAQPEQETMTNLMQPQQQQIETKPQPVPQLPADQLQQQTDSNERESGPGPAKRRKVDDENVISI